MLLKLKETDCTRKGKAYGKNSTEEVLPQIAKAFEETIDVFAWEELLHVLLLIGQSLSFPEKAESNVFNMLMGNNLLGRSETTHHRGPSAPP